MSDAGSSRRPRALVSWSSGKDSAWSLHVLREAAEFEIVGLLTTLNAEAERVAMHAVREKLVEAQAHAAGLPLWKVPLPTPCSNDDYNDAMQGVFERARAEGVEAVAFGDLFLEDIRRYREERMEGTGIEPIFPLWQRDTTELAQEIVRAGVRARITCVDPNVIDAELCGRDFDADFLRDLPAGVDPCGENGEFHTFVWAGPMLDRTIEVRTGERVERDGFVYRDLVPAEPSRA